MKLGVAAALLIAAAEAAAHAELAASNPADGTALAAPPAAVELVFNEPVRLLTLSLLDHSGIPVTLARPRAEGNVVRAEIEPLADGHYTLSYRITSLDSHPVSGAIAFGVGAGPPPAPAATAGATDFYRVVVRALRDIALLIAAGGALFALLVERFPGERPLLVSAATAGAVAALGGIGLQGTGLHSSFGLSACVACAGLLCIAAGSLLGGRGRATLLAGGAATALASLPMTGHAVASPLSMAALAAHGLAAAFWLGSLAALLALLWNERAAAALRRFSAFGVAAVALLAACGVALAALNLDSLDALWGAPYGRLILAKAALLVLLIALAAANRYRLLPALELGAPHAAQWLRRTVGVELVLMGAVVAVTALLVQTPPRAAAHEQVLKSGDRTAELSIVPARAGVNTVTVRLRDARGVALDAAEVTLEFANPARGVEALARPMQRLAPGRYSRSGTELAFAGEWRLAVHARIGDFEKISFSTAIVVR